MTLHTYTVIAALHAGWLFVAFLSLAPAIIVDKRKGKMFWLKLWLLFSAIPIGLTIVLFVLNARPRHGTSRSFTCGELSNNGWQVVGCPPSPNDKASPSVLRSPAAR